jgi:hypothetical protein
VIISSQLYDGCPYHDHFHYFLLLLLSINHCITFSFMIATTASIMCKDSFYNNSNLLLFICIAGSLTTDDRSILQTLLPRNIPQPSRPTIIQNVRIRFQGGSPTKPNPNLVFPALLLLPYLLSCSYLLITSHFQTTSLM